MAADPIRSSLLLTCQMHSSGDGEMMLPSWLLSGSGMSASRSYLQGVSERMIFLIRSDDFVLCANV